MITLTPTITLSRETVLTLAAAHIGHFTEVISLGGPGVNRAECQYYRTLWAEIRTVVSRGQELGSEHLEELYGAVTSRDYDGLLSSDELLAVLGGHKCASRLAHVGAGVFGLSESVEAGGST